VTHPLAYRCRYFDCGVGEEPHITTEAAALTDEAQTAADYEYDPRGGMANPRRRHLPGRSAGPRLRDPGH